MKQLTECTVGMIGAGKMANALIHGWLKAELFKPSQIAAYDVIPSSLKSLAESTGIRMGLSNRDAVVGADIIVVATRPPAVAPALAEIGDDLRAGQLVISIAAGVPIAVLEAELPQSAAAVRVMPNTPCLVGAGASAFSRGPSVSDGQANIVRQLFEAVGTAVEVPEVLLNAVTGLSGSGPAYAFIMIEALADGGVRAGLDRATAQALAAQTLLGAARMVLETGEHPGKLKDQVSSPAGTTIAGVAVLESRAVRSALMDAVVAAAARSAEMGRKI